MFELTFNYGVSGYRRGNDLKCITFHKFNKEGVDMEKALLESEFVQGLGYKEGDIMRLVNNDFVFKFEHSKATSS